MKRETWTTGPTELLEHAVQHISSGTTFDYRIALISIDNAVELIAKTFLRQPERVRGSKGPSRKEYDENSSSFPKLFNLLEKYSGDRIHGVNLGDIEYYHQVRNKLYHEAPVLSADPKDVDSYLQVAKVLMKQLLGKEPTGAVAETVSTLRGKFLVAWTELLDKIFSISYYIEPVARMEGRTLKTAIDILFRQGVLSGEGKVKLDEIFRMRNNIAHGTGRFSDSELNEVVFKLYTMIGELQLAESQVSKITKTSQGVESFSKEEKELLVASLPDGKFLEIAADQVSGSWIRAGRVNFRKVDDPSFAAIYMDTFTSLMQKGLVRHESRQSYILTGSGFTVARQLSETTDSDS